MNNIDIHTLQTQSEGQQFDRKSFRIEAKSLAVIAVAFANADGGDIAIGIEDNGRITGINGNDAHLNELLRVPFDFCVPSVQADVKFLDCNDVNGNPNRVMVMHIEPSMKVHSNQSDEAFYRVGDKFGQNFRPPLYCGKSGNIAGYGKNRQHQANAFFAQPKNRAVYAAIQIGERVWRRC